ncbi:diguanylate cyclase with PAS/PAC sensor [Sulfuricurvum kujiense DSM 16994]|uniref:Diguanylate cyclase with PAS/PAC sensor n=1 Tax=Sulfuricurvum kujiense (strain ATCC BAA-921 / DSM 16994 / JCM 11577 / YK-1) TaxID=709032 RepID=E4U265_SULKY|nr:diguanylate cyclase [Sulfuricurvum kujiense]ADR34622.1 diguanylate cyclase with PAS/PAC sensor [Sulfuricurvum kujiense DSM 16994]
MKVSEVDDSLLAIILQNIPFSVTTTTPEGLITRFSREAENLTGYKASEMIGKQTPVIFHYTPEVEERTIQFSNALGIAIEPGFDTFTIRSQLNLPNEFEWTYVRKDGTHIPVSLSVSALRDNDGIITGYVEIAKDLSKIKENQQKLMRSKQLLDEAQHLSAIGSWSLDLVENRLEWSDEIFRIFEIDQSRFEPSYEGFLNAIHPDDIEMVQKAFSDSVANKTQYTITHRLLMSDGRVKYVTERGKTTYNEDGTPLLSQGTVQDVTESRRIEKELNDYVALIDESVITSSTDLNGDIIYASNAFCRISKYDKSELIGKNHRIIRHPDMPAETYKELWNTLTHNQTWQGEIKNKAKDGSTYWVYAVISPDFDDNGNKRGYTAIRQDITDKKHAEELAITDRLTGLYNRLKLDEVLNYEIAQTSRYDTPLSIIIIDVDHFKNVNDTYGHQTGDMVLKEVAQILRSCSRKSDTSGRWGGEEFLIILPNTNLTGALEAAEKIRTAIENYPFSVVGQKTASLGVSEFLANENEDSFIERADQALYRAKSGGRNQVVG